jgi:hypothetical protein
MRDAMLKILRESTGEDGILTVRYEELVELLVEAVRYADDGRGETVDRKRRGGDLTHDEIVVACRNIGHDLKCGACAEVFYTGFTGDPHDLGCESTNRYPVVEEVVSGREEPPRREFEMSVEGQKILRGYATLPIMKVAGRLPADLIREYWEKIAVKMGFDVDTVEVISGTGKFTAVVRRCPGS